MRRAEIWKNLLTERNIRWILNLGILVFSVALAFFIHTRWEGMRPGLKVTVLCGASFAVMGAGHLVRRTIFKATGMALVILGAVALPIDGAALVTFGLVPSERVRELGLAGSMVCLAVYAGLARLYAERPFAWMASVAAASAWFFIAKVAGATGAQSVAWVVPFAAVAWSLSGRGPRAAFGWILFASASAAGASFFVGALDPVRDVASIEAALGALMAVVVLLRRGTGRRAFTWGAVAVLSAMFAAGIVHLGMAFADCWLPLAILGAAFGAGWRWRSLPFTGASAVAAALSLVACQGDLLRAALAVSVPAALHAAIGYARRDARHAFAGWLLSGLALAAALNGRGVDPLWQPPAYAAYGIVMVALSRRGMPEGFRFLGALGAGAAMFLLAASYMQYYLPKPAPAGQTPQILGASIAFLSALAFGPVANAMRSRLVSDITYACIGFGYILLLRWLGVPGNWLGLSVALLCVLYAALEKRVGRWLLRPTLFTGFACTLAAGIFAFLQWAVWKEYLQSSLTLILIGAFYLAVAWNTPWKWLAHAGTYVAAAGWVVGLRFLQAPAFSVPFWVFLPAAAGMVVAGRRKDLHLGVSNLVVALASLSLVYLDPSMYGPPGLRVTVAVSASAAALAGWFAFVRPVAPRLDARCLSALMGAFFAVAALLLIQESFPSSPWAAMASLGVAAALVGAASLLRRQGFDRQAWPLVAVSMGVTALSAFEAHARGIPQGMPIWVYSLALPMYAFAAAAFRRREFEWTAHACGAAAILSALAQGFVRHEPAQGAAGLLFAGALALVAGRTASRRRLIAAGLGALAAGTWLGLEALGVAREVRPLLVLVPAAGSLVAAARRRDMALGASSLGVAGVMLAFVYADPHMYGRTWLPIGIATSLVAGLVSAWFAFARQGYEGLYVRVAGALMGAFAAVAWVLFLMRLSTGSAWGALAVFAMAALMMVAADLLRRRAFGRQAAAVAVVSVPVTLAALVQAHRTGMEAGVHLWVYGLAAVAYTLVGRSFRRAGFSWTGAVSGMIGLAFWLLNWENPWVAVCTFALAGLGLQDREKPLGVLGRLAAILCPLVAAVGLHDLAAAGMVFVAMAALLIGTRLKWFAPYALAVGAIVSFGSYPWDAIVLFSGFAICLARGFFRRSVPFLYVGLFLGLLGDFVTAGGFPGHDGLVAMPLALVQFGIAWGTTRRLGRDLGRPLLWASFASALLATVLAVNDPTDRIWVLLGDALMLGCASVMLRRPGIMYLCSAAVVALDLSIALRFGLGSSQAAFQLLMLALAKVIFVRILGGRLGAYLQPVFVMSLFLAAGVLAFGVSRYETYSRAEIDLAIWGLILVAAVFGVAGRVKRLPALIYVAAANLMGAYYLSLHKHALTTLEFYTVPVGIGLGVWSLLAPVDKRLRALVEALAVAILFVPSAVQSYLPAKEAHALAALGLAFLAVLGGMALKRKVLLFGGTGVFVAEVLGKALHFLVEQQLDEWAWGMIAGALLIAIAASFEARKARFVRERLDELRAGAHKYFATWE
jgi:hypothetical protein